ncbi:MFS transporter [Agrobacterium tumefaciens]|nr:MFS transporter [Agrobacterium tumefaciens]NTA08329.1 MFS transporter [Agrobacterium tumefaciens]NTB16151.1 MFS transporter [Agrobacterium tumefaciens]
MGSFTLLSVACLTIMVGCVIVPGLPAIADAMGISKGASWLVTIPSLGVVVFGPLVGGLVARVGAKRALIAGLALYGLFGYGGAFLAGYFLVFLDRFLLGGATAVVMAGGTTLISEFFDGELRLKMIAKQGMAIELGGVIFLAIGGALATIGWRWPFLLYLMSWVFMAAVAYCIPNASPRLVAAPSATAGRISLGPMTDIFVAATLSMIAFFAAVILLPTKLGHLGMGEAGVGYFLSFVSLVAVAAAYFMPRVDKAIGPDRTLALAFLLYGLGHFILFATASIAPAVVAAISLGGGFGFSVPLVNHMTIERSSPSQRGALLGYLSSAIFLGQFLSALIEMAPVSGSLPFLIAAVVSVVAILILWLVQNKRAAA